MRCAGRARCPVPWLGPPAPARPTRAFRPAPDTLRAPTCVPADARRRAWSATDRSSRFPLAVLLAFQTLLLTPETTMRHVAAPPSPSWLLCCIGVSVVVARAPATHPLEAPRACDWGNPESAGNLQLVGSRRLEASIATWAHIARGPCIRWATVG